jgi:hypothetical protein
LPYIAAACVHLLLVVCAGSADLFAAFGKGGTLFPNSHDRLFGKAEKFVQSVLGNGSSRGNACSQGVALYLHSAGIEAGYNFFAPHVPGSHRLLFELHYGDGRIEYDVPHGDAPGSEVRLASLLDLIGHFTNNAVREGLICLMAEDICRQHRNVVMVRAFFGVVNFPRADVYEKGTNASYRVLYSYEFRPKRVVREAARQ